MKATRKIIEFWFMSICLLHLSCGGGDVSIDRTAGTESAVNGVSASSSNALTYFTNEIYPLMTQNRTGFTGGCAGAACHITGISGNPQTFFQINTSSATTSWSWAQVRRNRVITSTGFAISSSETLKTRKDANHNSFSTWTSAEKAKIDTWTSMP